MKSLPIRMRLTVWYLVVFSAALLAFGASAWMLVRQRLYNDLTRQLEWRADSVERFMLAQKSTLTLQQMRTELDEEYRTEDKVQWLQIIDQDGNWMFRAEPISTVSPTLSAPQTLPARGMNSTARTGDTRLLVLQRPANVFGRLYTIQVAIETNGVYHTLVSLRNILILLAPGMILIAAFGSYWMSRRALSAVDEITAKARSIHDRNLDSRLPTRSTNDELQRLSDTLNEMLARIEASFNRTRQFTADASHELRTPMSLIRTEAELTLRKSRTEEEYRKALEHILAESVRTSELIESLLTLARLDSGAQALQLSPVPAIAQLREIAADWHPTFREAHLQFEADLPAHEVMVSADQTSLRRLLMLLLDNACKYTPAGGRVWLRASRLANDLVIAVKDSGIGIETEHLPRIFDRFYRVDKARSRREGGAGLGLSLAKWIASQHHTAIEVDSTPGGGTTFSFRLRVTGTVPGKSNSAPSRTEKVV